MSTTGSFPFRRPATTVDPEADTRSCGNLKMDLVLGHPQKNNGPLQDTAYGLSILDIFYPPVALTRVFFTLTIFFPATAENLSQ